jgi:hypothetical protein
MWSKNAVLILLGICLVGALAVQPVSAADGEGGILEAIYDFFFWWLPSDEGTADEGSTETYSLEEPEIPGTNLTAPEENETLEENETVQPRTLGTVYAVEYHTVPPYGSAPMLVRFTAVEFEDGQYLWQFGDGFLSTERDHWHTYAAAGTYTATLTVSNSTGWSQTAEIAIQVEPPGVVPLPEEEMMF